MNSQEFLKQKFKEYYSSHEVDTVPDMETREFGCGEFGKKISRRHLFFQNKQQLNNFLKTDVPFYISYSTAYYEFPDNVYFETSGIQYALILKKIYQRFGANRIIFGSDYPFGDPRVSLAMIDTLGLNKNEYDKITAKNINKILAL